MFCISCRRAISQNDLFCPSCGKQLQRSRPLTITCRSCQASNPDDAIFCWNCGQRLHREESAVDFILPAPPFAGGGQPPAGMVPTVQGIPHAGGAPMVHGTPSAFDAPSVAPSTGHSFSQTPASATGQPLSQPAASSAGASPSQPPPAPRPPVRTTHGAQSPRAPHQPVYTSQTSPVSASRTKIASAGTRASRRFLRPRVVLALACVTLVVVAAATIGGLALGAFSQPPKPILSSGHTANLIQAPTLVAPTPTDTPIPTTPPAVFSSGTWQGQGQGTCFSASCQFDMTLIITVNGNSFSGTLTENVYNTTVNIIGTINGDTFSFTDTSYVSGTQIQLGCTYTGTVSNGSISGQWVYPNPQDGSGTLSLNLTS